MLSHDERGAVVTVILLILAPLLLAGILLVGEHPRLVHGSDVDLGQAVAEAVRAAAMCVDDASQASGQPRIEPGQAHETFRRVLARNLGLSEATLEPLPGSGMKSAPSYVLLIYNGDNPFVPVAREYVNGASADLPGGEFPRGFSVYDFGVSYASENATVELPSPGCVAVVKTRVKPVISGEAEAVRWAAARIITK